METQEVRTELKQVRDAANAISARMEKVLAPIRNQDETELLLRIILERDDITVESVKAQFFFSNLYGHEVRIDIVARDSTGKVYSVEVQRDMAEASVRRARFNGAMVDVSLLKKGQKYKELPDRYTIFITEEDMFHKGFPVYHAQNTVKELENAPLEDGGHIIYVNGQYRNTDTPIGRLMHDFYCTNPDDMLNPLFRERVSYLKKTEGGKNEMDRILERRINEDRIQQKTILVKKAILKGEFSIEQIAGILELSVEDVKKIADSMGEMIVSA